MTRTLPPREPAGLRDPLFASRLVHLVQRQAPITDYFAFVYSDLRRCDEGIPARLDRHVEGQTVVGQRAAHLPHEPRCPSAIRTHGMVLSPRPTTTPPIRADHDIDAPLASYSPDRSQVKGPALGQCPCGDRNVSRYW